MITNANMLKTIILVLVASSAYVTVLNFIFKKALFYCNIQCNEYLICGLSVLITTGTTWLILRKKRK